MDISEDLKLKLLAGKSINVQDSFIIYPITIDEIIDLGYEKYQSYLSSVIAEPSDYFTDKSIDLTDVTSFDIIMNNLYYDNQEYKSQIYESFNVFFRRIISPDFKKGLIKLTEFKKSNGHINLNKNYLYFNRDSFEEIKKIIRLQNCISDKVLEKEPVFENERQRDIYEKLMHGRKRQEIENSVSISTVFNSVVHGSNNYIPYNEVLNMTVFQLYNTFGTIFKIENYQQNFKMLLAGAESKDLDLTHWSKAIKI